MNSPMRIKPPAALPRSLMMAFSHLLYGHRHHVAVEIGDDPDGAGDDEKDDLHAEGEGQNIVRAVGPAAQMQKEDEADADLREGEYDQSDRYTRGPTANWSATRRKR